MRARILVIALLGAAAAVLATAKTYTFTLSDPSQAGSTKLNAGQYSLKLDGSTVVLKDSNGHDVAAKAKVENADQAFRDTEVALVRSAGNNKIEWIGLAGSKSKIIFQ